MTLPLYDGVLNHTDVIVGGVDGPLIPALAAPPTPPSAVVAP
jgi:hypothetical protein